MGKESNPKKTDSTGIPKALKDTHWSVVKLLQAISLAKAIITNIITHNQVSLFHPSSSRFIEDCITTANGFFPIIFPANKITAIISETTVGFIFIKS